MENRKHYILEFAQKVAIEWEMLKIDQLWGKFTERNGAPSKNPIIVIVYFLFYTLFREKNVDFLFSHKSSGLILKNRGYFSQKSVKQRRFQSFFFNEFS